MANDQFLDYPGLRHFWNKLKGYFVAKDGEKVLSDNNFTDLNSSDIKIARDRLYKTVTMEYPSGQIIANGADIGDGIAYIEAVYGNRVIDSETGTITQYGPSSISCTGWNLLTILSSQSRAWLVPYEPDSRYCISGTYGEITFAPESGGDRITITPDEGGHFTIPEEGMLYVKKASKDAAIWAARDGWEDSYPGEWEKTQSQTYLMNAQSLNLRQVKNVRDVWYPQTGKLCRNIDRLTYSEENLAIAQSSGRLYEYDSSYIYLVRKTPEISYVIVESYNTGNAYYVRNHGIERISVSGGYPCRMTISYPINQKRELSKDALILGPQELSEFQQAQVRKNIGLEDINERASGTVKYSEAQELSDDQKARARTNISAASASQLVTLAGNLATAENNLSTVTNDLSAAKTDLSETKTNLRTAERNLSRVDSTVNDLSTDLNAVKTDLSSTKTDLSDTKDDLGSTKTELADTKKNLSNAISDSVNYLRTDKDQGLTNAQKAQARTNAGAAAESRFLLEADLVPDTTQDIAFAANGSVNKIVYSNKGTNIRTDIFTYGTDSITETRILNTGEMLTIVTNTKTLRTITTYSEA